MVLGITGFDKKPSFERDVRRLDQKEKLHLRSAIDDLLLPQCPNSRNLERMKGYKDIYKIKVTYHTRLTFQVIDGVAVLRRVGPHDEIYNHP